MWGRRQAGSHRHRWAPTLAGSCRRCTGPPPPDRRRRARGRCRCRCNPANWRSRVGLAGQNRGVGAAAGAAAAIGRHFDAVGVGGAAGRSLGIGRGRAAAGQATGVVASEAVVALRGPIADHRSAHQHTQAVVARRLAGAIDCWRVAGDVFARLIPAARGRQRVGGADAAGGAGQGAVSGGRALGRGATAAAVGAGIGGTGGVLPGRLAAGQPEQGCTDEMEAGAHVEGCSTWRAAANPAKARADPTEF